MSIKTREMLKEEYDPRQVIGDDAILFLIEKESELRELRSKVYKEKKIEIARVNRKYDARASSIYKDIKAVMKAAKAISTHRIYFDLKHKYLWATGKKQYKNLPKDQRPDIDFNADPKITAKELGKIGVTEPQKKDKKQEQKNIEENVFKNND